MQDKIYYFFCGLMMGIADTIPGISGGTIAFITGIYENILNSIQAIDKRFFKLLYKREFKVALTKISWTFVLPLVGGIILAIFSFANIMTYLMETHIHFVWALFFGLILASLYILVKNLLKVQGHNILSLLVFILGFNISIVITFSNSISLPHTYPTIFFSGFLAICAMILPGISGAFVLVLLGQYQFILEAIANLDFSTILVFNLGSLCGLLSFANIVYICLKKFYKPSIAFLSGILAGSLIMVYPFVNIPLKLCYDNILLCFLVVLGLIIPLILQKISENNCYSIKNTERI